MKQLNIDFESEESFNWSNKKLYDLYIPSLNCIIEAHGGQHSGRGFSTLGGKTLEEEQENDRIKFINAIENGIMNYIVIDTRKSELEYLKKSILLSELAILFDLTTFDWMRCHQYSCKSLVKAVCDLWSKGSRSTKEISMKMNISIKTVIKYLKQGKELKWCNYDPEVMQKQGLKNALEKIIQLTIYGVKINEWSSATEASNTLKINKNSIYQVCKGKRKAAGGNVWILKEEYEIMGFKNPIT